MRAPTEQIISVSRLICTGCGSETNATCNCGLEYKPKSARAKEAVEANPEKSDRAIAAEIGVSDKTVAKARKATADNSAVEERTGLDGKKRKVPSAADRIEKNCAARWKRHLNKEDEFMGLGAGLGTVWPRLLPKNVRGSGT
jgi:hypothetical protein